MRVKGEMISERGYDATADEGDEDTLSTNREHRNFAVLVHEQALFSDSPEEERHSALSKVGSPSRQLTTGTNERGANSTSEFPMEE